MNQFEVENYDDARLGRVSTGTGTSTAAESSQAVGQHQRGGAVSVRAGDVEIARYETDPDSPQDEAPKPYLFPLRFTGGAEASVRRPWDHRWHTGLQFTWSHVDDQNFWGGASFDKETKWYVMKDNLGTMRHTGFRTAPAGGDEVVLDEDLQWITAAGEHWIDEHRVQRLHSLDLNRFAEGRGIWAVDLVTEITNVRGSTIDLGSPTTAGREKAGYTGWFWRGPRSWTGCKVVSSTGMEEDSTIMGTEAEWVAFSSEHDDFNGGGTVLVYSGSSTSEDTAVPPVKWFTRTGIFAVASPSPAFDQEIHLPADGTLKLNHRFVFIDQLLEGDELTAIAQEYAL
ncbi:DUF6807 domain-containing protein [Nesterenkonia alkaliphila]|uniref:Oxidoreductase n=1 Tax=Nesterenkonia alkaliphila TaxID=1463631 RepID=A0A7K1UHW3_9MICC|nr:PmoA family protein [Nesterenkonia alkaliphila]MVT25996.1 hypothetical protein [Nesterenkonia alkaliphila]GFZ85921.1 oxidoreductase [Nesterenkonia alkaliphila]